MPEQHRQRYFILNTITLFNHAVVSWLIIFMPTLLLGFHKTIINWSHFLMPSLSASNPHLAYTRFQPVFLGVLLSLKPLSESIVTFFYMRKPSLFAHHYLRFCLLFLIGSCVLFIMSIQYHYLWLLFVAQVALGFGCSAIFLIQVALTQMSSEQQRTHIFNYMEWSIGIGMSIGPIIGMLLVGSGLSASLQRPFIAIAALAVLILVALILSFKPVKPRDSNAYLKRINANHQIPKTPYFKLYLMAWLCFEFAWQGYFHWFSNLMHFHFSFNHQQVGYFFTGLGLFYMVCQFGIVRLFTRFPIHRRVILLTLPIIGLSFIVMGFTHSFFWLVMASAFYMLSISFFLPFWKAYVSLIGLTSHQRLFSYMTIVTCLSAVASTALMGVLASFSLFYLFLLFGLVMILAVVVFQVAERLRKCS
jgi:MFS family permease